MVVNHDGGISLHEVHVAGCYSASSSPSESYFLLFFTPLLTIVTTHHNLSIPKSRKTS